MKIQVDFLMNHSAQHKLITDKRSGMTRYFIIAEIIQSSPRAGTELISIC